MNQQTIEKLQYNTLKNTVASYCVSDLGRELIEKLMPSGNKKTVMNRLEETSEARRLLDITGSAPLAGIGSIGEVMTKLEKDSILSEEQLMIVMHFLAGCRKLKRSMKDRILEAPTLAGYAESVTEMGDLEETISQAIRNNRVADEASTLLKKTRRHMAITEEKIEEKLNQFIRNPHYKSYLQEQFISKRQGKWTVPIKSAYKNKVQGIVVEANDKTAFMEISTVSKYSAELVNLEIEESMEVYRILAELTEQVFSVLELMKRNMEVMAQLDLIFAKGKYSRTIDGIAPEVNDEGRIQIVGGRHPLLTGKVVPLHVHVGEAYRSLIITGPNAGGKTIVLKTIGLLTMAMASGFHVPAEKGTKLSVFDRIFVDIGDGQSIENALSTFSAHVKNLAEIVHQSNKSTLLLFDEIGSGTEPGEGAALAIAILEEVYKKGAMTIATTHYNEIKTFSEGHPDFQNAAMQFDRETLEPKYKLLIGEAGESNALWIAKRMGIDDALLGRAKAYMTEKNYNYDYVSKHKKRMATVEVVHEKVILNKGDVVYLHEQEVEGIVYQPKTIYQPLLVYLKGEMLEMDEKRLSLRRPATELYPEGYDLDTLFSDFKTRKLEHDLKRGSKKALKQLRKQ